MYLAQLIWHLMCYTVAFVAWAIGATICFGIGAFIGYIFSPSHTVAVIFGIVLGVIPFSIAMWVVAMITRETLDDIWPNRP